MLGPFRRFAGCALAAASMLLAASTAVANPTTGPDPTPPTPDTETVGDRPGRVVQGAWGDRFPPGTTPPAVVDGEPLDFRRTAATSPGNRILRDIVWIAQGGTNHRYRHQTKIRRAQGLYWWDCSGMATWLIRREAPVARAGLFSDRPTAEHYHDTIAASPTRGDRRGWRRIPTIDAVRPGDLLAFRLAPGEVSENTGHVAFVIRPPVTLPDVGDGAWAVRVADSTSKPHENDVRVEGRRTGFGFGTMLVVVDDDGVPFAYGWRGAQSDGIVETGIVFGRVTR